MPFQDRRGWTEAPGPSDGDISASGGVKIIDGKANRRTLVRRIRGTAGGAWDLVASDGTNTLVLESVPSGTVDIPGLELVAPRGWDIYADGNSNSVDDAEIKVQYGYEANIDQGETSVPED
jgi:hypothetical protein